MQGTTINKFCLELLPLHLAQSDHFLFAELAEGDLVSKKESSLKEPLFRGEVYRFFLNKNVCHSIGHAIIETPS